MPEPADLSRDAVFVRSTNAALHFDTLRAVAGPSGEQLRSLSASLQQYAAVGYQASHFAQAAALCGRMLVPQPPSAPVTQAVSGGAGGDAAQPAVLVQPTIFLGAAANLFGTGCREAIRFLCAESVPLPDGVLPAATPDEISVASCDKKDPTASLNPPFCSRALIHALVVSGGAMEHDIRRACEPYQIMNRGNAGGTLSNLRDEKRKPPQVFAADESEEVVVVGGKFGNITYGGGTALTPCMFASVMRRFVSRLIAEQQKQKAACEARPIPDAYNDTCLWAFCPSTVWYLAGRWLPDLFAEVLLERNAGVDKESVTDEAQQRAESTVVHWAAKNGLPVFSPSFADGDIIKFILEAERSTPATMFRLDLVVDIHRLNKFAMRSQRTGMIILGGGVVKHHVCNANLMRNGADYAVFINNGQEFDGSDAGARPDEAISWGKVRLDGDYVKVYAEVSLVFPLLVAQVFLPWVRAARGMSQTESNAKSAQ